MLLLLCLGLYAAGWPTTDLLSQQPAPNASFACVGCTQTSINDSNAVWPDVVSFGLNGEHCRSYSTVAQLRTCSAAVWSLVLTWIVLPGSLEPALSPNQACQALFKYYKMKGPGRSFWLSWAVARFLAPRTVRLAAYACLIGKGRMSTHRWAGLGLVTR